MRRQDLAHILRAACEVSQDPEIVVLGSQAILGAYDEDDLPALATASVEADLAWLADGPDRERAERVNGSIGELSHFDDTFGYYGEGISIKTAVLPEGWESRLTTWDLRSSEPARPKFLDKYDLAVAKLAAHRPKDLEFVGALLEHGLLDADALRERARMLEPSVDPRTRESVGAAVESLARAARKRVGRSTTDDADAPDRFRSEHVALRERLDRGPGSVRTASSEQGDSVESLPHPHSSPARRPGQRRGPTLG